MSDTPTDRMALAAEAKRLAFCCIFNQPTLTSAPKWRDVEAAIDALAASPLQSAGALTDEQIQKIIFRYTNVDAPYIRSIARDVEAAVHQSAGAGEPARIADLLHDLIEASEGIGRADAAKDHAAVLVLRQQRRETYHRIAEACGVVIFDGPDAFAESEAAKRQLDDEIEAAGGLEAWRAAAHLHPAPAGDATQGDAGALAAECKRIAHRLRNGSRKPSYLVLHEAGDLLERFAEFELPRLAAITKAGQADTGSTT